MSEANLAARGVSAVVGGGVPVCRGGAGSVACLRVVRPGEGCVGPIGRSRVRRAPAAFGECVRGLGENVTKEDEQHT